MELIINNPYGFIYITTNIINGKKYIGQKKFNQYWKTYLGSGIVFKKAIKKYGKENFHRNIVAIAYSKEELNNLEIEFIQLHNATNDDNYYNIGAGGYENNFAGKTEMEMIEIRRKISNAHKGKKRGCFSKEHKDKISKSNKGKIISKQHKEKLSIALSGRVLSEESKQKNRQSHIGKKLSEKTKKKIGNSNKGKGSRKVICVTTNKVFNSLTEGADFYNCNVHHMSECCKNIRKSCGKLEDGTKLVWRYYEEYIESRK